MKDFAARLVRWQRQQGRHDLPWQVADPYRVWLSEIMLQQTQVATVCAYYARFVAQFPDVFALAAAPLEAVFALWSGLGYYRRAENLHRAAVMVVAQWGGHFPHHRAELEQLPGVGRSTAAAIAVFAFGQREAILDGNVKRVLARHAGLEGDPNGAEFWQVAEARLPETAADLRAYTQGLMDLGTLICRPKNPDCPACPVREDCYAQAHHAQDCLPSKKAKKALLQETQAVLIARSRGKLYLERRPAGGIWARLWCFPLNARPEALRTHAQTLGQILTFRPGEVLRHRFTHRLWLMCPYYAELEGDTTGAGWFTPQEVATMAIPAPVRKWCSQEMGIAEGSATL